MKKIVYISGGTGGACFCGHAANLLKKDPSAFSLTVIQSPYDDGGHSGLIVREYGIFGPGDFRKSILALSKPWMSDELHSAFSRRQWHPVQPENTEPTILLEEPPLGNLIMLSGMLKYGKINPGLGLLNGIRVFSEACGMPEMFKVMPISIDRATLSAKLADGSSIIGQSSITKHHDFDDRRIISVELVPPPNMLKPEIYGKALQAIMEADIIVITSGSFWTSIWPNTLPAGFKEAMATTKAKIAMVVNLVTDQSESSRWNSGEFVGKLSKAIDRPFDAILCHDWELEINQWKQKMQTGRLSHFEEKQISELLGKYENHEFYPVVFSHPVLHELTQEKAFKKVIKGLFGSWDGKSFSHNSLAMERTLTL